MDETKVKVYKIFESNPLLWGYHYFPHHFRISSPPFHLKIVRESMENKYLAVQAPRGSAKSTMLGFLKLCHSISFKRKRFIIIIQNTYTKAAQSLETIKEEIKNNKRFVSDFGIKVTRDREGDSIFNVSGHRVRVMCKGSEQIGSIRGEKFGAYRPDLILGDDIEDDELVRNPERRLQLEREFNDVLKYAGDYDTQFIILGTILHDDSLMCKLVSLEQYKMYRKLFYKARWESGGQLRSLWPQKWTVEALNQMEEDDPVSFAKEMQGDPSSGSLETIQREDFRYWAEANNGVELYNSDGGLKNRWNWKDCKAAIGIDLAWEEKKANDFSVFVPGIVTPTNDILIDNYVMKKGMRPDEWETVVFEMVHKYTTLTGKRVQVGLEKSKLEKVMKWFLQEAQRRRNEWLWLKEISWGTKDKIERFYFRMANRYAQHSVFHKKGMGIYENQIIRLRSSAHDDLADAAGMLPEMLAYAPGVKKTVTQDSKFDWWAKQTSSYREKNKSRYIFGNRQRPSAVPTVMAPPV